MSLRYAIKNFDEKKMAKARINDVGVSLKVAIEICNMIRNNTTEKAKQMLHEVVEQKKAVPFKRFNLDVGHKKKIGPGRYPQKASKTMISLLNLVEANAQDKGLGTDLKIIHLVANKGTGQWRFGRQRRRKMKRAHIEVAVEELEVKKADKKKPEHKEGKKEETKAEKKTEVKETQKVEDKKVQSSKPASTDKPKAKKTEEKKKK
ncbi:50S ribosomal protein L22 [Candidatus Woesearchaeota archaeon]|nr:50S ribosomal protein L22 [Candidatus Woesearchaeota archaeon]